mgnify:CR=1 FL=1
MKLKVNQTLTDLKGTPFTIPTGKGKNRENVTLGLLLLNIILEPHPNKPGFRPLDAYKLAQKLESQKEIDITAAEFVQIREIVESNESNAPILLGQALEMLDSCEK